MTPVVSRRAAAIDDLDEIAEFIQGRSGMDRAIRFLRAAEATCQQLARMPGMGARYELPGRAVEIRYFPITRHRNHVVFYQATADGIEFLRGLHGARDLGDILTPEDQAGDDEPV